MKSTVIIGLTTVCLAMAPAKKIDFKFKLNKGKTYTQTTLVESHTKQTLQGQTMETDNTITGTTTYQLTEGNTYEIAYTSIGMKITGMGNTQEFNSDTTALESVDPMSRVLSSIANESFAAKIDENGKVSDVSGLDKIIENSAKSGGAAGAQISEQLSASFGDEGLAKNVETFTDIFPEGAVSVGDSWTIEKQTATGMPILSKDTYTLSALDGNLAVLDVKSVLSTDPENSSTKLQGMSAQYFIEGTRTGTLNVEIKTGWVSHAEMADDIYGSITLAPSAQLPDGMTIPIEVKNKITVEGK